MHVGTSLVALSTEQIRVLQVTNGNRNQKGLGFEVQISWVDPTLISTPNKDQNASDTLNKS